MNREELKQRFCLNLHHVVAKYYDVHSALFCEYMEHHQQHLLLVFYRVAAYITQDIFQQVMDMENHNLFWLPKTCEVMIIMNCLTKYQYHLLQHPLENGDEILYYDPNEEEME